MPDGPVEVPASVVRASAGAEVAAVWQNELGGLTFRIDPATTGGVTRFCKWSPRSAGIDLGAEAARLAWARRFTSVPRVLELLDGPDEQVLITAGIPGRSAVDPHWLGEPRAAARGIGAGLRALHETLPVDDCPFRWDVEHRLRPANDPTRRRLIADAPPVARLVVCHGDACAPNTLLAGDGSTAGHVDLGSLGTGDLWADLAVAALSTRWNYGPGFESEVYDGYGIEPDAERITFYRRLWEAT